MKRRCSPGEIRGFSFIWHAWQNACDCFILAAMDTTPQKPTSQAAQQPIISSKKKGGKNSGRTPLVIFVIVFLLIIGAITWLIVSGRLTLVWGNGGSGQVQVASSRIVCDDKTVTTYNQAALYAVRPGSNLPTLDKEGLKKLSADIKTRDGYKDDPTCQNILFWQSINDNDYTGAKDNLVALKALHEKHLYPNNNLANTQGLSGYDQALESINPQQSTAKPGRENEG